MLIANAVISYGYAKDEIVSVAGTLYPVAVFAAAAHTLDTLTVRAELLTHEPITMTPLEAVVGAREPQTVRLLLERGARVDDSNWTRLVCFAERLDADEVVDILNQQLPGRPMPDCAGVAIPFEP